MGANMKPQMPLMSGRCGDYVFYGAHSVRLRCTYGAHPMWMA
jgi:hypothetical protein